MASPSPRLGYAPPSSPYAPTYPPYAPPPTTPPPPQAPQPQPAKPYLDLEVTVVSAKHLKNVNWRHGELKPYAVAYLDTGRRAATKPDDTGSTRPVWNERLLLPLPSSPDDDPSLLLTLDVFHSKPSETPKPLVGTACSPLRDLLSPDPAPVLRILPLLRPSGRPQGKLRIKLAMRERPLPPPEPSFRAAPPSSYSGADSREYHSSYSHPHPSAVPLAPYGHSVLPQAAQYPYANGGYLDYSPAYHSSAVPYFMAGPVPARAPVMVPTRSYYDRPSGYGGPSAPVDYSSGSYSYEQRAKGGRFGMGTGLSVGVVTGTLGGMTLEEGSKYEEGKIPEKAEHDQAAGDNYSDCRVSY